MLKRYVGAMGQHMRRPVCRYIRSLSLVKCTMLLLYIEISKEISEEPGCSNVPTAYWETKLVNLSQEVRLCVYCSLVYHQSVVVIVIVLRFRSINGIETPSSDL